MKIILFKLKFFFSNLFSNKDLPDFILIKQYGTFETKFIAYEDKIYTISKGERFYAHHIPIVRHTKDIYTSQHVLDNRLKRVYKNLSGISYENLLNSIPKEVLKQLVKLHKEGK